MATLTLQPSRRLLTVADYVALPEDGDDARYELQEGVLMTSPSPVPEHQICVDELMYQLRGRFKAAEYADAGVPRYWIVDLGEPGDRPQLTAHHLAGEFGYADAGRVTGGVFAATGPFHVRIDLDALAE